MKHAFLLTSLLFVLTAGFAQKYEHYSREITKNGELEQLELPVLFSINLLVGSVSMMESGVETKLKLNPENIIYSNDTKSTQVVVWEILKDVGPHQIVIYNHDKVEDERELCILLGNKKECYLNIYPFQKAN